MTKQIFDVARLDVYSHDVKFENVSESPVRYAAAFVYEHRYAEHEYEYENASKGGFLVDWLRRIWRCSTKSVISSSLLAHDVQLAWGQIAISHSFSVQ